MTAAGPSDAKRGLCSAGLGRAAAFDPFLGAVLYFQQLLTQKLKKKETHMTTKTKKDTKSKVPAQAEEDLTGITVCASKASGKWVVTGVAVKPVAEGKPFGQLLELVEDFLNKNIDIVVSDAPRKREP